MMTINHKKEYEDMQISNPCMANEPAMAYQRRNTDSGITRMMTQKEIDAECFSLEESKSKLVDKIQRHFQRS